MSKTLGILGGGQLAQMLALAAVPMGIKSMVLEPDANAPARLCAKHIHAPYTDKKGLAQLAECDAITLEFENVPVEAVMQLQNKTPLRPAASLLATTKNRVREKTALQVTGALTAPFVAIDKAVDLVGALDQVGGFGILKTAELGYDGKGQIRVHSPEELKNAWQDLEQVPCVLEGFIEFEREVSLAVARNKSGEITFGPLVENVHLNGILRTSVYRAQSPIGTEELACKIAKNIAQHWQLEGLITIEFFQLPDGGLIVNEVAPRVHNSGHLTQDGGNMSQFEAQIRAVLDMPLRNWSPLFPTAMVNYVGVHGKECDWKAIESLPGTRVHLYHKEWRAGRKLGHVNLVAPDQETLYERLAELQDMVPY